MDTEGEVNTVAETEENKSEVKVVGEDVKETEANMDSPADISPLNLKVEVNEAVEVEEIKSKVKVEENETRDVEKEVVPLEVTLANKTDDLPETEVGQVCIEEKASSDYQVSGGKDEVNKIPLKKKRTSPL